MRAENASGTDRDGGAQLVFERERRRANKRSADIFAIPVPERVYCNIMRGKVILRSSWCTRMVGGKVAWCGIDSCLPMFFVRIIRNLFKYILYYTFLSCLHSV